MQDLLDQLRTKIAERNAEDFLSDLIANYDIALGNFLIRKQMIKDGCNNPHCHECRDSDTFEDDMID